MPDAAKRRWLLLALALACAACGGARETDSGSGSATACNYVAWFADDGLVSQLVRDQSQSEMPSNATRVSARCVCILLCCSQLDGTGFD